MKSRFKNWITSIFGILIMLCAVLWKFVPSVGAMVDYEASTFDFILMMFVGWVFLSAKDSLIEGVLGGIIRLKPAKNDSKDDVKDDSEVG